MKLMVVPLNTLNNMGKLYSDIKMALTVRLKITQSGKNKNKLNCWFVLVKAYL